MEEKPNNILESMKNQLFCNNVTGNISLVQNALEYTENAHHGQCRDNGTPYVLHPLRVALILLNELKIRDIDIICAALLHDTAEDHKNFSAEYIEKYFGSKVFKMVDILTKQKKYSKVPRKINRVYFKRLTDSDEDTKLVKLADKLDNLRDLINCPDFKKRVRTIHEVQDFYLKLIDSLLNEKYKHIFQELFEKALNKMQHFEKFKEIKT